MKKGIMVAVLIAGTVCLTGVSFAEAKGPDDVKVIVHLEAEKTPPYVAKHDAPRPPKNDPAPKPVMTHGPHGPKGPKPMAHKPAPKPVMAPGSHHGPAHKVPHGPDIHPEKPAPKPHQEGHRQKDGLK